MNYECPLSKNRLQEEQEELLLKMALVRYFEREDANLRAAVAECPDLPEDRESAEHAVDRAMRQQHWKVVGQKVWRASAKVVTRAAVVFLTFFIFLTTVFAASAPVRDAIYKILFSHEDRYTLVQVDPTVSDAFIDADLYTWEHCFAPTYLPKGYKLTTFDDIAGNMFMPSNDASKSVDFVDSIAGIATSDRNGKRTTAGNTPVVAMDAKFMFVEGLGFVYYLNDGDEAKFVPANFKGVNGDVFTTQNGGIVAIDNELLTYAQQLAEIVEEQNLYLSSLAPGENPATGTGMTAYIAESPQHGESDALFAGFVLFGTIALMTCVVMAAKRNRTVR